MPWSQDRFTSLTHCIADVLDSYGMVLSLLSRNQWGAHSFYYGF